MRIPTVKEIMNYLFNKHPIANEAMSGAMPALAQAWGVRYTPSQLKVVEKGGVKEEENGYPTGIEADTDLVLETGRYKNIWDRFCLMNTMQMETAYPFPEVVVSQEKAKALLDEAALSLALQRGAPPSGPRKGFVNRGRPDRPRLSRKGVESAACPLFTASLLLPGLGEDGGERQVLPHCPALLNGSYDVR